MTGTQHPEDHDAGLVHFRSIPPCLRGWPFLPAPLIPPAVSFPSQAQPSSNFFYYFYCAPCGPPRHSLVILKKTKNFDPWPLCTGSFSPTTNVLLFDGLLFASQISSIHPLFTIHSPTIHLPIFGHLPYTKSMWFCLQNLQMSSK